MTPFHRQKKAASTFWLSGAWLVLVLFSFGLFFVADPWKENITGIGWVQGHKGLMAAYCLYACSFCGWLSWKFCLAWNQLKTGWLLAGSWELIAVGCLMPWQNGQPGNFFLDLHSLLCTGGIILQCLLFLRMYTLWQTLALLKQTAGWALVFAGISIALFAWSQVISLVCEVAYVCLYASLFTWRLVHNDS